MLTTNEPLRREWTRFLRPGRLVALATAALVVVTLGLLYAAGSKQSCDGSCPSALTGPDGSHVNDQFAFLHRHLGESGSVTVRLASMTGTITYPPPHHDRIVPGLVPWAKAGIIVKDGVRQGSSYAALMLTGSHGVRMQYDYHHDLAGSDAPVTSPRWLRLTRSGETITGYESADGKRWSKVGAARLPGLPASVRIGLFATSPGDLTLRPTGLGGATEESRFTQASGVFDHVSLKGSAATGDWSEDTIGEMNHTDWEKHHQASGAEVEGDTLTVTGAGDVGPEGAEDGRQPVERTLGGLTIAVFIVLVVAVRFVASGYGNGDVRVTRRELWGKAVVVGAVTFVTGLLTIGTVLPAGRALLTGNGVPVIAVSAFTEVRVVVGTATVLALAAVLALALGALLRRGWLAILVATVAVAVPYAVTSIPLLPDGLSQWLLRLTPAAGFATQQTLVEYPQVTAHYAPSAGYFPLPWWVGIAVLGAYTATLLGLALRSRSRATDGAQGGVLHPR